MYTKQTKAWNNAANYFNLQPGQVMHHKDVNLKYTDIERYKQWRIEDLVVMTRAEHIKLHHTGAKRSEESKAKMRAAAHHMHTKGSEGMHWYNDGTNTVFAYECPDGFVKGRLNGKNPFRDELGKFAHANAEVSQ